MNSNNMLQLEGAVENIVYRNEQNGYTVLEIADGEDLITAVGIMPQASVGDTINLTGFFITHKTYGKQFSVSACEICRPT